MFHIRSLFLLRFSKSLVFQGIQRGKSLLYAFVVLFEKRMICPGHFHSSEVLVTDSTDENLFYRSTLLAVEGVYSNQS